jgi:hypothetical protein
MCKRLFVPFLSLGLLLLLPITATGGGKLGITNNIANQPHSTVPAPAAQSSRSGSMPKLVLGLESLYDEFLSYQPAKQQALQQGKMVTPFRSKGTLARTFEDSVVIDALAFENSDTLVKDLRRLGGKNVVSYENLVSACVPINDLPKIAGLASLRFARLAISMTHVGAVTSQGEVAMDAANARAFYGIDGSGVTVGVLSDSYDCLGGAASGIASGDLPSDVNVLLDDTGIGCGATDEGRAMLEIVHDVAPGAGLAFHSANLGEASFAQGIVDLANIANAQVIVDDVIYLAEPMFQDGRVAQAVESVGMQDVSYFSSAGNNAKSSYEADYMAGTFYNTNAFPRLDASLPIFAGGISHDFSGLGDDKQQITLQPGATLVAVLQWQNAFPSLGGPIPTKDDLDVYLLDPFNNMIAASAVDQSVGADPVEIFGFTNNDSNAVTVNLMIVSHSQTNPGRIKYVLFGTGFSIDEYRTFSGSSYGHANSAHARAVGAAYYTSTPAFGVSPALLESYSSRGGVPIFFDVTGNALGTAIIRPKPEFVAPDGVNTTFFYPGSDRDSDGYPNFSGTSAAAPHAGAVASLLKSASASASSSEIYAALQESAIDMGSTGFDFDTGFGLIQATSALAYLSSQDSAGLLGFASRANGTPLQTGDAFIATEYIAKGITINDNDITPGEINVNFIASETAGIKGNFIQVNGTSPQILVTFSPPVNHVEFDFVSADGSVSVEAYDEFDTPVSTVFFSGTNSFSITGFTGFAGHANLTTQTPMTKLVINAAAIDNLLFNDAPISAVVQVPLLPPLAYCLMLLALAGFGAIKSRRPFLTFVSR